MIEDEVAMMAGRDPIVGIFGDQNFPNISSGKSVSERKEVLGRMKRLLLRLKPERVYISPTKGVSRCLIPAMNMLGIPYVIVNPYRGFFDSPQRKEKLHLIFGIKNSRSVITMGNPPESEESKRNLVKESEDFIIERSNVVISVFGKNPSPDIKNLNKRLPSAETNVVFLDYSLT